MPYLNVIKYIKDNIKVDVAGQAGPMDTPPPAVLFQKIKIRGPMKLHNIFSFTNAVPILTHVGSFAF